MTDGDLFQTHKAFDAVVETLLRMLDKDVIDYVRHCNQYFWLLKAYIQLVSWSVLTDGGWVLENGGACTQSGVTCLGSVLLPADGVLMSASASLFHV